MSPALHTQRIPGGLNSRDVRLRVIRPVLWGLGVFHPRLGGLAAEEQVFGIALAESRLRDLKQRGGGPALGLYQCEPATHDDILRYLARPDKAKLARLVARHATAANREDQLITNLAYATCICRVHLWRIPDPLPKPGDHRSQAHYWKRHYNTAKGKGTVEHYLAAIDGHMDPAV